MANNPRLTAALGGFAYLLHRYGPERLAALAKGFAYAIGTFFVGMTIWELATAVRRGMELITPARMDGDQEDDKKDKDLDALAAKIVKEIKEQDPDIVKKLSTENTMTDEEIATAKQSIDELTTGPDDLQKHSGTIAKTAEAIQSGGDTSTLDRESMHLYRKVTNQKDPNAGTVYEDLQPDEVLKEKKEFGEADPDDPIALTNADPIVKSASKWKKDHDLARQRERELEAMHAKHYADEKKSAADAAKKPAPEVAPGDETTPTEILTAADKKLFGEKDPDAAISLTDTDPILKSRSQQQSDYEAKKQRYKELDAMHKANYNKQVAVIPQKEPPKEEAAEPTKEEAADASALPVEVNPQDAMQQMQQQQQQPKGPSGERDDVVEDRIMRDVDADEQASVEAGAWQYPSMAESYNQAGLIATSLRRAKRRLDAVNRQTWRRRR
jgi:hypothetical protein